MRSRMKGIIEGWFMYALFSLGLITDPDVLSQLDHRKGKCEKCPLKSGKWCSSRKSVQKVIHIRKRFGSIKTESENITGCGCYLDAKYFASFEKTKCPMGKWQK